MRPHPLALVLALTLAAVQPAPAAETVVLSMVEVTEWKAVYGRIEPRDRVPARARIGGTLADLAVAEGDMVAEGQVLARVADEKLGLQLSALAAQRDALAAQLANAETERRRAEDLLQQGVTTAQRVDAVRTQVDVLRGQLAALDAQADVIRRTEAEGAVLSPAAGRVVDVPVARGAVVMPGEPVALLAVGGTFLRLAIPERHAADLTLGAEIRIEGAPPGRLARIYPLIENGRVVADVEVQGLDDRFVDARLLVRLPVGRRMALLVPETALVTQGGLDFVAVAGPDGPVLRAVVPGQRADGMAEILSGLAAGDRVLAVAPAAGAVHE
jgi:RND family efflux transporter MFP subunit